MSHLKKRPIKKIQQEILRTLLILASVTTILIAVISIIVNIQSDRNSLDLNLKNIAQAVSQSQAVIDEMSGVPSENTDSVMRHYLDTLKRSVSNIDVISVVDVDRIRRYHTNLSLLGTVYDGTMPNFSSDNNHVYVTSDTGPSGSQRRAYAAIYDDRGNYLGFVMTVMLNQNYYTIILNTILIHLISAVAVIIAAMMLSKHLSRKIKDLLLGYEPDTFSSMFSIRDNVLETLDEGILAVGSDEKMIYVNHAAKKMLRISEEISSGRRLKGVLNHMPLRQTLSKGEKFSGILIHPSHGSDVLVDLIPVTEKDQITGALCILHDRTEYTKIMEDLSGVRYMVESMRANNHDFTNKLHVILGLIQMGETVKASEYITNIASLQQTVIHNIVVNIKDQSVAALMIGKYTRASELNIRFALESGSRLSRGDISLPSGDLVTLIGNLIDNAMESMNEKNELPKEMTVGIFTKPHAIIIRVDDTGNGISEKNRENIFENGYSTRGEGRGTGLYIVKNLVLKYGGTIALESELGTGTSFTLTLTDKEDEDGL